ncbi:MAG: hypothetical protein LQ349_000306 [Xanthoria aureola]|nr:MAG: hypothetical protein LQ349_000306 [Xanthoria aureola]
MTYHEQLRFVKAGILQARNWLLSNSPGHPRAYVKAGILQARNWLLSDSPGHPRAYVNTMVSWALEQHRTGAIYRNTGLAFVAENASEWGDVLLEPIYENSYGRYVLRGLSYAKVAHDIFFQMLLLLQITLGDMLGETNAWIFVYLVYVLAIYQLLRLIRKVVAILWNTLFAIFLLLSALFYLIGKLFTITFCRHTAAT